MRTIVNISVPDTVAKEIKQTAKQRGFATVSEYMRYLVRQERERELAGSLLKDKLLFEQGKGKVLKSLRDLK